LAFSTASRAWSTYGDHKHRWRRPAFASAGGQGDWPVAASRRSTRPYGRLGAAASVVATAVGENKVAMSWLRPG
jgi:hypothetical protein